MKTKVLVIGCGRWGTFIAWYLNSLGLDVSLYGSFFTITVPKIWNGTTATTTNKTETTTATANKRNNVWNDKGFILCVP